MSDRWAVHHGDCREVMEAMEPQSIDSIVCDPPYGLSFMGKGWDHGVPGVEFWAAALRVAKPGAHLLAFGGTRTFHRLTVAIEDAGWDIRDCLMWVYGSGFPKSHDVSKAIDKAAGAEREMRINERWADRYPNGPGGNLSGDGRSEHFSQAKRIVGNPLLTSDPATDAARQWSGWGTALKPAWEPIILARKPLSGTVAANVLEYGTGGINVDGCRVDSDGSHCRPFQPTNNDRGVYGKQQAFQPTNALGRWPANLIHDGSDEVVGLFPQTTSKAVSGVSRLNGVLKHGGTNARPSHGTSQRVTDEEGYNDSGSAARFFYCCPPDATCPLCCLPYAEACNTMQAWKNTLASIAEKRGWTSQATSEFIARVSAIGPVSERIVPHVKSAGNVCDSCAISIAVALVATKNSAFSSEELQAILASTRSCNASILIPSLASFAELWASIDITPTTSSLSLLFGSVRDAIANSTRQDTRAKAELRCAPSRFAYVPKASKADRDEGCEGLAEIRRSDGRTTEHHVPNLRTTTRRNHHPTVKPTDLMRYLCRLVTPSGGLVFDPFTGSGSTGKAAMLEGLRFVGAELSPEYIEIARARIGHAAGQTRQKELALA